MPRCPVHVQEELESKRKGWFCEECGAIVVGFDESPPPASMRLGDEDMVDEPSAGRARTAEEITLPRVAVDAPEALKAELADAGWSRERVAKSSREAARKTIARIRGERPHPELYVERVWFDEAAASAAMRSGRALLLLGEPGSGKTDWVCRWLGGVLADGDDGDAVVLVSGAEAWAPAGKAPAGALPAVVRALGATHEAVGSMAELLERLGGGMGTPAGPDTTKHRVLLVLDGLDEATDPEAVRAEVDALLPEVGRHGWLRLVVTMRRSAYEAVVSEEPGTIGAACPFRNAQWLATFYDVAGRQSTPYVEVRPWREETEARSGYEVMQRSSPENCAAFRWDKLSPQLRGLLCTPWCLAVFHAAFAGVDEAPSSLDAIGLVQAWLSSLDKSVTGAAALVDEIGSAAMHGRHMAVVDNAIALWSKGQGDAAQPRLAALRTNGLLAESPREKGPPARRFRLHRVAEAMLARELMRRIAPRVVPSSDLLLTWARNAGKPKGGEAFPALAGALELLITRWVIDGESGFVPSLLDLDDDDVRRGLVGAALKSLGPSWGAQEQPSPAATRLLEVLATTASKPARLKRLLAAAWPALDWLRSRGYLRAADELVHRLVGLLHNPASKALDVPDRRLFGQALCSLGRHAALSGRREDTQRCIEDAFRISGDVVSAAEPDAVLLRVVATSLGRAVDVAVRAGDLPRARIRAQEALRAARKLVKHQADERHSHKLLMQALVALGDVSLAEGNAVQARGCAQEAGGAGRTAVAEFGFDPDIRRWKAEASAALARAYRAEGEAKPSRESTDAALRAMRKLVRSEPQRFDLRFDLAQMLDRHAARLLAEREDDLARRALDEAAGLMIALVEANPEQTRWLHAVSQLLVTLGLVLRARGELESSRACFEESVRHARSYVARGEDPLSGKDLVMALSQLGHLEAADGRRTEARRAFREALDIARAPRMTSVLEEPPRVIAMLLTAMGRLAADDGDREGARWHVGEAVKELSSWMATRQGRIDLQAELCHVLGVAAELAGGAATSPQRPARYRFAIAVREPGAAEVKEYFDRDEITIGRAPGNDLMLPNYSVSRHHAVVRYDQGRFSIVDLGSKHGTKVRGERVTVRQEVAPGDQVDLGDFVLHFEPGPTVTAREAADDAAPLPAAIAVAETVPPPAMQAPRAEPAEGRKEITIDLDVADFLEVLDKPAEP